MERSRLIFNETPPKVDNLKELIEELHNVFKENYINVEYVQQLMENYKASPSEFKEFAIFDQFRYTRNLIDEGNGKFNLMLLCWAPSNVSSIHDHADSHCFMKAIKGSLEETRYEYPNTSETDKIKEIERNVPKANEVVYINDSLGVHRVANLSKSDEAISLHLYVPPYNECKIFEEGTSKKTSCRVTFWSKYGVKESLSNKDLNSCTCD